MPRKPREPESVEEYLRRGGEIQYIPQGVQADLEPAKRTPAQVRDRKRNRDHAIAVDAGRLKAVDEGRLTPSNEETT